MEKTDEEIHQEMLELPKIKRVQFMTGDKAVELINEWLNLAIEVGDMNLNRMEYDEERYNYAMERMDVIRKEINEYHEHMNKC